MINKNFDSRQWLMVGIGTILFCYMSLGVAQEQDRIKQLITALCTECDVEAKRDAQNKLARLGKVAIPYLLQTLSDSSIRMQEKDWVLQTVSYIGGPEAVDGLASCLGISNSPDYQSCVIIALSEALIPENEYPKAVQLLFEITKNPAYHEDVRTRCVRGIAAYLVRKNRFVYLIQYLENA